MADGKTQRKQRQQLETDRLLGVDTVPTPRSIPAVPVVVNTVAPDNVSAEAPTPAEPAYIATTGGKALDRDQKAKLLSQLDCDEVRGCTKCVLSETRIQTVFGEGDPDAGLMFIGEGPGQNEDEKGRPFIGRAGDLLSKQIAAMGMERSDVFIANIVKCRPPNNRAPAPLEVDACWGYLRQQIQIIQPKVIVTLGGPAMKLLLKTTKGITMLRGTWHQFDGLAPEGPPIPVMPTFHPAYLLRAYTVENRKKVWSDLQKAMQVLDGVEK